MITLRKADDRGRVKLDWLDSQHTFSFGHYYDPEHIGFSALRVINDDIVKPNTGFDTHPHKNMEIISYVLKGSIQHKDSEGNIQLLPAGEFQLMSAGSGIFHSEHNPSQSEDLQLLQIWIEPNVTNTPPNYQQKSFGEKVGLTTIASPSGENGSLKIKQDMRLYLLLLEPNSSHTLSLSNQRRFYVHQATGELKLGDNILSSGDGAKLEELDNIVFHNPSDTQATALIFDLP